MNSSKRKRHNLYFWIDVFFLTLPIIFVILNFLSSLIPYFHSLALSEYIYSYIEPDGTHTIRITNILSSLSSSASRCFELSISNINSMFDFIYFEYEDSIFFTIVSSIDDFFYSFFGDVYYDSYFLSFICNCFIYFIFYEFLSFLISVVLWIPRFFKNKLYDRGFME